MAKNFKKYPINQCALYKCRNKRLLEKFLTLQKYDLDRISNILEYHKFQISKKKSPKQISTPKNIEVKKRDITAPCLDLKLLQARILRLLQPIERPEWLISGEKGKCYVDNAKMHLNSDYALTIDIQGFYDHCRREYVYCFFKDSLLTSRDVAGVLTDIVTSDNCIPTGCPTSQIIAYYAYQKMFQEIYILAKQYECIFTLYVDDMAFSSTQPFNPKKLLSAVSTILYKYGHRLKYSKSKYYPKSSNKLYTGTAVTPNHQLRVSNSLQEKIYYNFQNIKNWELEPLTEEQEKRLLSLKGQLHVARKVELEKFPEISRLVQSVQLSKESIGGKGQKRKTRKCICVPRSTNSTKVFEKPI